VRHPWYLALLISTFVALQRGICATFMGGFSAGYDAVAIALYRQAVYIPPNPPREKSNNSGGCCFVLCSASDKKVPIVFGPRVIDTPRR